MSMKLELVVREWLRGCSIGGTDEPEACDDCTKLMKRKAMAVLAEIDDMREGNAPDEYEAFTVWLEGYTHRNTCVRLNMNRYMYDSYKEGIAFNERENKEGEGGSNP